MSFCAKCGAELPEDAKFCPKCGKKINGKTIREEFEVKGSELADKVKNLVHEGNVRRIMILNQEGKTVCEFPLTIGVIGTVLAPILAAVGGIATLAMKYTIVVERRE